MTGWRSTSLRLAEQTCPKSLEFLERGAPHDRRIFAVGTAAHAILEAVGKAASLDEDWLPPEKVEEIARATCESLIREGRDFEGEREPPLPSDAVWRGRDLVLAYLREEPMRPDLKYEEGVAVNRQWMLCPYDAGAWLRCRIDAAGTRLPGLLDDEEIGGPILEIRDYKSSWQADDSELYTIQRKIQAVLGWLAWGDGHDALRLIVINFRTRRRYETTVFPESDEGAEVMACWRADIESEIAAREAQRAPDGTWPASPGAQCFGCPYVQQCSAAMTHLAKAHGSADPADLARGYAVAYALLDSLKAPLKHATAEAPIPVHGGFVGTLGKEERALTRDAPERLAEVWLRKAHPETLEMATAQLPGLLKALGLGVAQAESLLGFLYRGSDEEREKRMRELGRVLTTKVTRKFGVHAAPPKEAA